MDLCLSIESINSNKFTDDSFNGKFCLISIRTPFFEAMKEQQIYKSVQNSSLPTTRYLIDFSYGSVLGLCIPSKCNIEELLEPINRNLRKYQLEVIPPKHCTVGIDYNFIDLKFLVFL